MVWGNPGLLPGVACQTLADAQHEAELARAKDPSTPTTGTLVSQGLTVVEKGMDVLASVTGSKSGNTTPKSDEKQKKD